VLALETADISGLDDSYGTNCINQALRHARACKAWLELLISRRPAKLPDWKTAASGDQQ